jgi:basic membrane protein A
MISSTSRRRLSIGALAALGLVAVASGGAVTMAATDTTSPATTAGEGGAGGDYHWVMVTDQAGLGDQGFNDLAYAGITRAADELGGDAQALESSEQAQYVPNLQQAVDSGATMTVGVGFLITDAMVEVAQANSDARFVLIDSLAADESGEPLPNVQSVTFREHEAAYLLGIIAGMTTETNKLGFIGGLEGPPVLRFLHGFEQGLASVNPDATVEVAYAGSFDDPAAVKELAAGFYDAGADIIFEVAGLGGLGAYEEAAERGPGFWAAGTDTCKDQLAPDNYLSSATKDVSGAVFLAAQSIVDGSFEGGAVDLGITEDAVGVCEDTFGDLPQEVQDAVNEAREAIKSGDLTVSPD